MESKESAFLHEVFNAIVESYTSIVYMDAEDKKCYPVRLDGFSARYENTLREGISMHDMMARYVNDAVFADDGADVLRLADYEYVSDRLATENPIHHIYKVIKDDDVMHYRLKVVPIENGRKIVYGFENIDRQYREQIEIKSRFDLQMRFLEGLSREYLSVWYLDGKTRKIKLIQNNGSEAENGEPVRIGSSLIDYHFSMQKYFGSFVDPEEFDRLMELTSYDSLVENAGSDVLYPINYIRLNPDGSRSHFQVCYAKLTDEKGIANFVFGYRNTDKALE